MSERLEAESHKGLRDGDLPSDKVIPSVESAHCSLQVIRRHMGGGRERDIGGSKGEEEGGRG